MPFAPSPSPATSFCPSRYWDEFVADVEASPYQWHEPLQYLTGVSNDATRAAASSDLYGRLGVLLSADTHSFLRHHVPSYQSWAMDNGCFADAHRDFDSWLQEAVDIVETVDGAHEGLRFVVAPDVVGSHAGTLERAAEWLPKIRARQLPAAFVLQDGATVETVPWGQFDVLFIGGSDELKLGHPTSRGRTLTYDRHSDASQQVARIWAEAHHRGVPMHVGRVNSAIRMQFAREIGAATADGTYLAFSGGQRGLDTIRRWVA